MQIGDTPPASVEEMLARLQVQIVVSRRIELGSEWKLELNSPFWRLYCEEDSRASIFFGGKRTRLQAGRLYVIPSWVRFQTSLSVRSWQNFIHFYLSGFPRSLQEGIFDRPLLLPRDPLLDTLSERWRGGLRTSPGLAELAWTHALVHAALATAVAALPAESQALCLRWLAEANEVRPALDCIDRRLDMPPSNPELARLCHVSTDHFIRRFHRAIGMSPGRYGLERRTAVAAQWLIATSRTIEDISAATGFADRFHFSKSFKAQFGVAPAAYRRMH